LGEIAMKILQRDVLRNLIGRHADKFEGLNRLSCLAVVDLERLAGFFYNEIELTDEEAVRLEDVLIQEHKGGMF